MTEPKEGRVKGWLKIGTGQCLLVVRVAALGLAVSQGLLWIGGGLTLGSTAYRWAGVCLEWVKRKIHLSKKEKAPQRQPGKLTHLSVAHALGENPPGKKS